MRKILVLGLLLWLQNGLRAQYVYTINADSVKITNHCDTAELIIENHTQSVPGFLFNKGRGRTEFRRAVVALDDSTYLLGTDTLHTDRPSFWKPGNDLTYGQSIYNANTGYVGIGTSTPQRILDVNGPLRVRSGILELTEGPRCGIRQTCLSTHIFNGCGTLGYISLGFDSLTGVGTANSDPLTVQQVNMSVGINNYNPQAKLHIKGGGATCATSSFLVHNSQSAELFRILDNGNIGIGRTSPKVMLDLPGPVSIDDTSAYRINYHPVLSIGDPEPDGYTNLYVGDSSGVNNGNTTYNTLIGGRAGINNTGNSSTFLGYAAGNDNEGSENTFVGSFSGQNNSADDISSRADFNAFLGFGSGQFNSGSDNTFLGGYAGNSNTGFNNTFCGIHAGSSNQGSYNLLAGDLCGLNNTGNENVFMGSGTGLNSIGDNNILLGQNAGNQNVGYNNVFIGLSAGYYNQGSNNTFIGNGAGYEQAYGNGVSGYGITLIGSGAIVGNTPNLSDATAIGNNAVVNASGTMVFGDGAVNTWIFNSNATVPAGAALVVGSNSGNGNGAYLTTGGVWTNASDRNKKEHFEPVNTSDMLEKIAALPITRWNYKGLQEQHIGPVAQDFYRLFQVGADDKTISTIDPSGIALAGVQGLYYKWQEATQKVEEQQATINNLQLQLQQQQAQIAGQQAQLTLLLEKFTTLETALDNKTNQATRN